jgi:hypothetical protein
MKCAGLSSNRAALVAPPTAFAPPGGLGKVAAPPTSPASSSSCEDGESKLGPSSSSGRSMCVQSSGPAGVDFSLLGRKSLLRYAKVYHIDAATEELEKLGDEALAARVAEHFRKYSVKTTDAVTEFIGAIRRR